MTGGNLWGADIDELTRLGSILATRARQLSRLTGQISSEIHRLDHVWGGEDSAEFRHHWTAHDRPKLLDAATGLMKAATTIEHNRHAQELTSAPDGGVTTGPATPPIMPAPSAPADPTGASEASAEAADALEDIRATLDAGDDLAVTERELNSIQDRLAELDDDDLAHVLGGLSDRQLEVLFHNVHSSGFWSNDWSDGQRSEFYQNLMRAGETADVELWYRLGRFSPHLNPDPAGGLPDTARELNEQPTIEFWEGLSYEERTDQALWSDGGEPVDYTDVRQGSIGDCYLISAMISLAREDPSIIQDLITENPNGTYTVHFADGSREVVTPDLVYNANGDPAFARTASGDAAWPAVIEKAYAQRFGGWGSDPGITGGQSSAAIEALTGRDASYIRAGELDLDDLAQRFDNGELLGLSTIDRPDDLTQEEWLALDDTPDTFKGDDRYQKLHQNHAFIVVDVDQADGTISVINPWNPSKEPYTMTFEDMQQSVNGVRVNEAP